jgi:hypothetical protein
MQLTKNEPSSGNVALTPRAMRNTQQSAMQWRTQANKEEDMLLQPQDTDNITLSDSCLDNVWPWLLNASCWFGCTYLLNLLLWGPFPYVDSLVAHFENFWYQK